MVVVGEEKAPAIDKRRLAIVLEALANENRLELLEQLRYPRTVSEIELTPESPREGENAERRISRQAVRAHLQRLVDIGVVMARRARRAGVAADEHVLNHPRLFAILEDLRALGSLQTSSTHVPGPEATLERSLPTGDHAASPRLVLVKGLNEGRVFPLSRSLLADDGRGWIVGRRPDLAVALDYDPFVSSQNSEITCDGRAWRLHDLRSSRNGTTLNWARLPRGGAVELAHGDVIGVGRSLLLFRDR